MKKIWIMLGMFLFCIVGAFAYTPSADLQDKIEVVVDKFEDIIDVKGESYRTRILAVLSDYKIKYSENERATYILEYVYDSLEADADETTESSSETVTSYDSVSLAFIQESYADSLVGDVEIVDCILSGGTETSCYKFTVAPDATSDHAIGPWCPTNISDSAEAGGIWPDDGQIYEVSGSFIENLAVFYNDDSWQLYDTETGEINVTDTKISCEGAAKPNVEEQYQNHCVECSLTYMDEIPNITYTIPVTPVTTNSTQSVSNSIGIGVAFNGVKFDASAPAELILAANTVAPFDDCGGHINLVVGYHYHEATGCSKEVSLIDDHEGAIGFAFDGFPMFSQAADESDLDTCGGHIVNGTYHYHVSSTGTNEFLGCYAAEYGCASEDPDATCDASSSSSSSTQGGGPGGAGGPPGGAGGPPGR